MFCHCVLDAKVMPSAYVVSSIGACGVGVSDVYMLNNVGDITPPWRHLGATLALC